MLIERAYGAKPERMYFVGSSEGGREGLTMAQRYPADFDGIFARVPVINWVGLQHAGTRAGLATMGDGWIRPAQVKLVHDAVLAACDAQDGVADALVQDAVGCKARFDAAKLLCAGGASGDSASARRRSRPFGRCTRRTNSRSRSPTASASIRAGAFPARRPNPMARPADGARGGWARHRRRCRRSPTTASPGSTAPAASRISSRAIPNFDVRKYRPEDFADRVREVSALMDSTNPDLGAFKARGGKLVMLENMADYAQSPYAGIGYFQEVQKRMGEAAVADFMRLYAAPGVDHVGSGAPANVDMLQVLVDWVENGRAPGDLVVVEQQPALPVTVDRSLPLCRWPAWPHYKAGDPKSAASFVCAP